MWPVPHWGSACVTPQWLAQSQTWHHQWFQWKEKGRSATFHAKHLFPEHRKIKLHSSSLQLGCSLGWESDLLCPGHDFPDGRLGLRMPCRTNLTNLKSFASKLGGYHTRYADVKLVLKEAARRGQCLHTDLQNKSAYFLRICTIWDILELL